ncbi:hypothetical protein [Nocardia sp. NPDC050413]|uniref:hypothetical protein n=1 Tax=Nocardia sp. NPDC050413 TaxID=3155784 RepID=UPI0033F211CD
MRLWAPFDHATRRTTIEIVIGDTVTFGHGIHFCLGAHVARQEFALVLAELARYPNYHLAGTPTRYFENGRHICLDSLPVIFDHPTKDV